MASAGGEPVLQAKLSAKAEPAQADTEEPSSEDEILDVSKSSESELYATMKKQDILTFVNVAKQVIDEYIDYKAKSPEESQSESASSRAGSTSSTSRAEPVHKIKRYLSIIQGALDVALKFLENPDNGKLKQHEGALRGVLKLAEVGSFLVSFGVLYLASDYFEICKDHYKEEVDFIDYALSDAKDRVETIGRYVEEASEYLKEVISQVQFNHLKAQKFDICIAHARQEIEPCENSLLSANKVLEETVWNLQGRRWLFVGVKYTCLAGMCYGIYSLYKRDLMSMPVAAISSGCVLVGGIALNLQQADEVYRNLMKLRTDIMKLQLKLDNLKIEMHSNAHRMSAFKKQAGYESPAGTPFSRSA